jgi:hypothetical protein
MKKVIHQIQYCTVYEIGKIKLYTIQMQVCVMHCLEQSMLQALPIFF